MEKAERVRVKAITVPAARAKTLHPTTVRLLAADLLANGLQTPIIVRTRGRRYVLVEGLHRLEAAKWLDWPEVDAVVLPGADT